MATITQTKDTTAALAGPRFDLDVAGWFRSTVFSSVWHTLSAAILIVANILIIRAAFNAQPVSLSVNLAPDGQPTALGNLILSLTNGALLSSILLILWAVGAIAVVYSAGRHHWPGPTHWLKDSLYTGPFGALTTLALSFIMIFAIRALLSWTIFGAIFTSDPVLANEIRASGPPTGAIWGIVGANTKLFAVGLYPPEFVWRIWASLGVVLLLGVSSFAAWGFGSPLKQFRKPLVWAWLASTVVIYFLVSGLPSITSGPLQSVPTNRWGGFLLTLLLSVAGIVISFPIGLVLALGRRSQTKGVPLLWLWVAILLGIYWLFGGFPTQEKTFNVPLLFRDPPIWVVTLSPITYAALQAIVVVGLAWIISTYLTGNLIKTLSVVYIELIRGVPLITVLFMAQVMLPILLPKGLEIDNLLRVTVGIILFSAAYLAENVRGGLQAIPKGQYEAAMAIGLSNAQSMRLIILPQALRAVIPAIVGQFISLFKDTSLVSIVGLFDLLKIASTVVAQPDWIGLQKETYAFVALVYWIFAFSMSRASQRLERKLGVGKY